MSRARPHLAALLLLPLSGCVRGPEAPSSCERPGTLEVALESGALLNPDAEGHALPTEVRLYRLRQPRAFETVAFDAIWQSETEALGDALVGSDSLTLYPVETARTELLLGPDVTALAAVAIVRQPAGRTWRAVVPVEALPCGARASVRFHVDEYRIERAARAPEGD